LAASGFAIAAFILIWFRMQGTEEDQISKILVPPGANARTEDEPERLLLKSRGN